MQYTEENIGNWNDLINKKKDQIILHYSFDFWNTIAISNSLFKQKRAEYIISLSNNDFTINQINLAFSKIGNEYNNEIENGLKSISLLELYKKVLVELNCTSITKIELLIKEVKKIFIKYPPIIDDNFLNYYESIKNNNITFSITSNTGFISADVIKDFLNLSGIDKNFNFYLFSDEFGFGKPNINIFNELVREVKKFHPTISLNEIIHIGDNYITDYLGAINSGIKAYQINFSNSLLYPKYAVHSIINKDKLPIIAEEYSKFKFGDNSLANKFANELFEYFISNHSSWLNGKNDNIVIYSSPYSNVPTSSYFLSIAFYQLLDNYLKESTNYFFKLKWGKINRCQTYSEDYGSLNANQRYQLIKNDTYVFAEKPSENDSLIFIDDISITGTHQKVIENLLKINNYNNECIFIYYTKLDNSSIEPYFENELNCSYVNSFNKFLNVINSKSFKITSRSLKYILKLPESEFIYFLQSLSNSNKNGLIEQFYSSSISNGYDKISEFKKNSLTLKSFLNQTNININI
jgi:FMN phosphatase YigB (HAD superfamily)